jgi:hypothetical protein
MQTVEELDVFKLSHETALTIHPQNYEDLRSNCERISQMLTALAKSLTIK